MKIQYGLRSFLSQNELLVKEERWPGTP